MPQTETMKALKAWRKKNELSQSQAAKNLGVSVRTLQNWEIGRNEPSGFAKTALFKLLGVEAKAAALAGVKKRREAKGME